MTTTLAVGALAVLALLPWLVAATLRPGRQLPPQPGPAHTGPQPE